MLETRQSNTSSFLPNFCDTRMVFAVILMAELLAIILTLAQPAYVQERWFSLALYSMFIQCISITCSIALCLSRDRLNALADPWTATLSFLLIMLVAFGFIQILWWIFSRWPVAGNDGSAYWTFILRSMGITGIAGALALRYFYVQHQWRRNVQLESNMRFNALQARIQPHFLFNCMNTIASLTRKDPATAEQVVEDLADLFRASLQGSSRLVTLSEELALCRRYINIESLRLGSRLTVDWAVEDLPGDFLIPSLTLQPLLENAIYYGIEPRDEGGEIQIKGVTFPGAMTVEISNPLPIDSSVSSQSGCHLAQDNIRQRLHVVFKDRAHMSINEDEKQYTVIITFPRGPG